MTTPPPDTKEGLVPVMVDVGAFIAGLGLVGVLCFTAADVVASPWRAAGLGVILVAAAAAAWPRRSLAAGLSGGAVAALAIWVLVMAGGYLVAHF
jgi:hypothetical protein